MKVLTNFNVLLRVNSDRYDARRILLLGGLALRLLRN